MARTIDYLQALAAEPLPRTVTSEPELELVRLLKLAGWVDADLGPGTGAVVNRITFSGQAVLQVAQGFMRSSGIRTGRA
jgi:hypothetical protein